MESKIYELITRHFLASCSKNAEGQETYVEISIGYEKFHAKGLVLLKKNYLEIYVYEKWTENELPFFEEG